MLTKVIDYLKQQDHTWYIKWGVSIVMLVGMAIGRGTGAPNPVYKLIDTTCSWVGAVGWTYVGFRWNDKAILLVNLLMATINTIGILSQLHII